MPHKPKKIPNIVYLANQSKSLKSYGRNYKVKNYKKILTVEGNIKPTALCSEYTFKIIYKVNCRPKVLITHPEIISFDDNIPVPHIYGKNMPCLFYPDYDEFNKDKMISDTIIPWLSLWLYYYEVWFATGGEWLGGGIHYSAEE